MTWLISPAYKNAAVSDADAQTYLRAVETADSQALEPAVAVAVNDFVIGCKSDGIWPAIKASCILSGARTLTGALVPLVGTAPTNFNFVSGDYNRKTGLVGNGSSKYLNSNRNNNADPQDNQHLSVFVTVEPTAEATFISSPNITGRSIVYGSSSFTATSSRGSTAGATTSHSGLTNKLAAISRATNSQYIVQIGGAATTIGATSLSPAAGNITVFSIGGAFTTNARLAFYSIGESLNLALLDTRVATLINAFAAAIP
jgi:hypothetical protein